MAHILITDDSSFLRRITCNILSATKHRISQAGNGLECMQAMATSNTADIPDVILLDLVMPEMNGIEVLKALKQQHNPVPVIILSADIQSSVKKECLELGAVAFLNKPPNEGEVLQAVQTALEMRRIKP